GCGRVCPGCDPLRAVDRPAAVPGRNADGDASASDSPGADAASPAESQRGARSGNRVPEVSAKRTTRTICQRPSAGRGPPALLARTSDRSSTGRTPGENRKVDPAQPSDCKSIGRGGVHAPGGNGGVLAICHGSAPTGRAGHGSSGQIGEADD